MDKITKNLDVQSTSSPYKTSSQIIKEAKESLASNIVMNTRIVKTNRPFTPKSNQRILFDEEKRSGRPSSSVSFQNVTYNEPQPQVPVQDDEEIQRTNIKLPALLNYKSMHTLDKLPEEFSEISTLETRGTYSSPSVGSKVRHVMNRNEHIWLPLVPTSAGHSSNEVPIRLTCPHWLDIKKTIRDNKINEARVLWKSETEETVHNVMATINKTSIRSCKDEEMIDLLQRLYYCLEKEQQVQYANDPHPAKNLILKSVFSLIHSPNEILLLHLLQIILLLGVTESNLATVCKLIFKISRSDRNDEIFLKMNIIGSFVNCLGLATPDDDSEALIYGYGALKFLMMNESILNSALENGILQLMALHLKMINLAKTEGSNFPEQTCHVLFQLTGCLRNVANDGSTHSKFVSSGTLSALCKTIRLFVSDIDLVINVARILSILSTNTECCDNVADDGSALHTQLKICKRYPNREDIIVRVMYAIGNILGNCDRARFQLYSSAEGVVDIISNLLHYYLEIDLTLSLENTFNKSHLLSVEDVFIKIIRVIANMSLDENVGMALISTTDSRERMDEFLNCLLIILRRKTIQENEELVMSTLCTLNNLSYYSLPNVEGPLTKGCLDICEALNPFVPTRHSICLLEVGRVYGNLSRLAVVRKYLLDSGNLYYILQWLDSPNKDLLLITIGVLINMMEEKEARQFLMFSKGIEKLIQNLQHYIKEDWYLGNLVCQLLWNFSVDEDNLFTILDHKQAQTLLYTLIDFLDEDQFFPDYNDLLKTSEYKLWEEFSFVATNILEKMETKTYFD